MKRKIALLAVVAIALSLAAYGTVAYFSAEGTAHNVLTMGSVKIELSDKTLTGTGPDATEVDFNVEYPNGMPVMPSSEASKIVYVTNTGANACWVRVKVDKTANPSDDEALNSDYIKINFDETHWLDGKDGYWYYREILESTEKTENLFTKVSFDKDMGNDYMNSEFSITVSAQAIQSDNNAIPENGTVLDVWNGNN